MPLVAVVAGPYTGTYTPAAGSGASGVGGSALSQGILTDDGYEVSWVTHAQRANNTDQFGDTLLQSVFRGANWNIRYHIREYPTSGALNGNVINAAYPWGKVVGASSSGVLSPVLGQCGRLGTDVAGAIVLTAISGTSASTNPSTLTAASVIASDNVRTAMNLTVRIREFPIELILYPYSTTLNSTAYNLWFVTT